MEEYNINEDIEKAIETAYTVDIRHDEPSMAFDFPVSSGWYMDTEQKAVVMIKARSRRIEAIVRAVIYGSKAITNYPKIVQMANLQEILKKDALARLEAEIIERKKLEVLVESLRNEREVIENKMEQIALFFSRYAVGKVTDADVEWAKGEIKQYEDAKDV